MVHMASICRQATPRWTRGRSDLTLEEELVDFLAEWIAGAACEVDAWAPGLTEGHLGGLIERFSSARKSIAWNGQAVCRCFSKCTRPELPSTVALPRRNRSSFW
ncbi:unnamed protein product [Effrenium voratum]|uniref:Uncharacterized protein n=1 Tax=Effrenium voratum TaxID=2562239 RepID=A0AA36IYI9_9DINO|nr:unnamed protein product [Effrenium voratum]CAJ1423579.1 unnamed protein product [Effrenium voratum]